MYSQLNYAGCIIPLTDVQLNALESKIADFVTGRMRLSRDKLFSPVKEGGLGLFPVKEFLGAQKCSWVLRAQDLDEVWKIELNAPAKGNLDLLPASSNENPILQEIILSWESFYNKFTKINYLGVRIIKNKVLTLDLRSRDCLEPVDFNMDFYMTHKI
jgi:hypothetical protein